MQGRAPVDALRPVLEQLDVEGEIDFVRHVAGERRLIVPVRLPGRDTIVTIDYGRRTANVTSRDRPMGEAFVYLHKMPWPHNADVRGNSWLVRAWRMLADATAYLLLFIIVSGICLWVSLRAERRIGFVLLLAGAVTFWGLVYAALLDGTSDDRPERGATATFLVWNRRLHYDLGLYFLFFTWLLVFTGLLLNHPRWQFAQFWPNRIQTSTEQQVQPPAGGSDVERADDLMRQLRIIGEIQWRTQQPGAGLLTFQVNRPGLIVDIKADIEQSRATVQRTQLMPGASCTCFTHSPVFVPLMLATLATGR